VEGHDLELAGAPPVRLAGEQLALEEPDRTAGENEDDREPPAGGSPPAVDDAADARFLDRKELELIDYHERPLVRDELLDGCERRLPARRGLLREQDVAGDARELGGQVQQLLGPRDVRGCTSSSPGSARGRSTG
jgi:hypothetical protein